MTLPVPGAQGVPVSSGTGPQLALNDTDQKLIMELVAGISPANEVLQRYGLTAADLKAKCRNRMFASAYREAQRTWKSDLNVHERIKWKAAMLLEDSLLELARIVQNQDIGVGAKRDAIESLAKLSDAWEPGKRKHEQAPAQSVRISINLGDTTPKQVVIEGQTVAMEASE